MRKKSSHYYVRAVIDCVNYCTNQINVIKYNKVRKNYNNNLFFFPEWLKKSWQNLFTLLAE